MTVCKKGEQAKMINSEIDRKRNCLFNRAYVSTINKLCDYILEQVEDQIYVLVWEKAFARWKKLFS